MTAQIPDGFHYRGRRYELAAATNWERLAFYPSDYGIYIAGMIHTACMRGYTLEYAVDEDNRLVLKSLLVNIGKLDADSKKERSSLAVADRAPSINGVAPRASDDGLASYEDVGLRFDYTGSILLGADFRSRSSYMAPYVDSWYVEPFDYGEMWELDFENGVLQNVVDRSNEVERLMKLLARPALLVESISTIQKLRRFVGKAQPTFLKGIESFELGNGRKALVFSNDNEAIEFLSDSKKIKALGWKIAELPNNDVDYRSFWDENKEFRETLSAYRIYKEFCFLGDDKARAFLSSYGYCGNYCFLSNNGFSEANLVEKAGLLAFGENFARWFGEEEAAE